MSRLEKFLELCGDMEAFSRGEDELTRMVDQTRDEMNEDELEWVSAAGKKPDFSAFLKKAEESGLRR